MKSHWLVVLLSILLFIVVSQATTNSTYTPSTDCAICHDAMTLPEYIQRFECPHTEFHNQCIDRWLTTKGPLATCPICRKARLNSLNPSTDCRLNPSLEFQRYIHGHYSLFLAHLEHLDRQSLQSNTSMFMFERNIDHFTILLDQEEYEVLGVVVKHSTTDIIQIALHNCIKNKLWVSTLALIRIMSDQGTRIDLSSVLHISVLKEMPVESYVEMLELDNAIVNREDAGGVLFYIAYFAKIDMLDVTLQLVVRNRIVFDAAVSDRILNAVRDIYINGLLERVLQYPVFTRNL